MSLEEALTIKEYEIGSASKFYDWMIRNNYIGIKTGEKRILTTHLLEYYQIAKIRHHAH